MKLRSLFEHLKPPRGFHLARAGWIFFVFLVGIIVAAMATGNNLLFLVLAVMLAFMIVSGIESERNLRHLEMARILPAEIYAGGQTRIRYHLRNRRNTSVRLVIDDRHPLKVSRLDQGPALAVPAATVFERRGRVPLGPVTVSTTYPYGLFAKSITFDLHDEALVFPGPIETSSVSDRGSSGSGRGHDRDSISHVRAYQPGDPLAAIVWKKRHLGLITRVAEGGSATARLIVLRPPGDLEDKLGRATHLINDLHTRGGAFGLIVNDFNSGLGTSRQHKLAILAHLAELQAINEPQAENIDANGTVVYL